jgi:hypothetical protein
MKRLAKVILALVIFYVGIVVAFETWLGYSQPRGEQNLVLTMTDDDGTQVTRVLSLFESDGELYLAANHWPRAWFRQVQRNPEVHIEFGGERVAESGDYTVTPISETDHERVLNDNPISLVGRILMGFPPREFLHLEPRS